MNNKVVLITGASSGMGKVTAQILVENGYTVYAAARRIEKMNDLKQTGEYFKWILPMRTPCKSV